MAKYNIQITKDGKFSANACMVINEDHNTYVHECPLFDTIDEVQTWIIENAKYITECK